VPTSIPRAGRPFAIALTCLGAFVAFLDVTIVNIAFPDIARSFPGTDIADLSWVLNAYNVVFAALLVVAGRIADLVGRRRLYAGGLALFTLASAWCAAAGSPEELVAARVLQAVGAAGVVPASLALLLPLFPPARRASAVAIWTATAAVASGVGPSLGGALIDAWGWRAVFLVNVPLGVLAVPLAVRLLAEQRDEAGRMPDLLGTALLAGAVGTLALGIVQGGTWGWDGAAVLGCFGAAVVLGLLAVRRVARHTSPIVAPELLRVPSFAAANAATLVVAAAFYAAILCNVLFLTTVWRLSVLEAGLAVTPAPLVAVLAAGLAPRITGRFGDRGAIASGALLLAAGVGWFALETGTTTAFVEQWLPGMVLVGAGVGLAFPALGNAALTAVPDAQLGTATAVNATARQIGAVVGIAVLVAILGDAGQIEAASFARGWTFCAALAAGVAALTIAAGRRRPVPAAVPNQA
jgi:NTE family protein